MENCIASYVDTLHALRPFIKTVRVLKVEELISLPFISGIETIYILKKEQRALKEQFVQT